MNEQWDPTLHRLNKDVLEAHGWPPFGGMTDIVNGWPGELLNERGVYVFLAAGDRRITYPVGESSIVYFGKAEQERGVRGRVSQHRGRIKRGPQEQSPGHPAHEWLMARGGFCLFSVAPERVPGAGLRNSAAWLEGQLVQAFQRLHRTRPVGNGIAA